MKETIFFFEKPHKYILYEPLEYVPLKMELK